MVVGQFISPWQEGRAQVVWFSLFPLSLKLRVSTEVQKQKKYMPC